MSKYVNAIYENGVFRPLEPVELAEHQQVQVELPGAGNGPGPEPADWLDEAYRAEVEAELQGVSPDQIPSLAEVRAGLAQLPGRVSEWIRNERDQ